MGEVIHIEGNVTAANALRNIADEMESGKYDSDEATVIVGNDVFHCGLVDDSRAAEQAIFNMTFGIHKLMHPCVDEDI